MKYLREQQELEKIGKRIARLREAQGISQAQLGFEAEVPRFQISRIERGAINAGISTYIRLAKALDVSITAFFET